MFFGVFFGGGIFLGGPVRLFYRHPSADPGALILQTKLFSISWGFLSKIWQNIEFALHQEKSWMRTFLGNSLSANDHFLTIVNRAWLDFGRSHSQRSTGPAIAKTIVSIPMTV